MEVAPDGKVKMTDLLNNDTALQKKLDQLDIQLVGFGDYVSETQNLVTDPQFMSQLLSQTANQESGSFLHFQKNLQKKLSEHIDQTLNSKVSQNKDFTKIMLAHHLSQQKAKN